jgi:2-succinyl-6-hydroxy-2,4-cyclohexadiene-1-carboxylate synthase
MVGWAMPTLLLRKYECSLFITFAGMVDYFLSANPALLHRYRKGRPTILFLHGFMGDRHEFQLISALLANEYQCLSFDLPGHGATQVTENSDYEMAPTARAIIAALDQLQISRCFLVGYSMGGRLALYLMLRFPDRFTGALLESASPGLKTQEERDRRSRQDWQLAAELEAVDFTAFLVKWYSQPLFASLVQSPGFEQMLERRRQNNPAELAKSLRYLGTGAQPSLWTELALNRVPLCLVVGELDQKFVAINREMRSLCPSAHLEIIKGCGHNIHFENERGFADRLIEFLRTMGHAKRLNGA